MTDTFSVEKRSDIMRKVRSSNTAPERLVRRLLHQSGYRFRLVDNRLPGSPDIVLPKYRAAIFVHGCFWHRHKGCPEAALPKSNTKYWELKFARNEKRDRSIRRKLRILGWQVITVWECQTKSPKHLLSRLRKALHAAQAYELLANETGLLAAEDPAGYVKSNRHSLGRKRARRKSDIKQGISV